VLIGAEGHIGRDSRDVSSAVGRNDQRKIGDIARGMALVRMACGIEVSSSRFKVGRLAFGVLVDVNGMFARGKILDVESDLDASGNRRQESSSHALALGIDEVDGYGLGRGMGMSVLGESGWRYKQEQSGTNESLHWDSPLRVLCLRDYGQPEKYIVMSLTKQAAEMSWSCKK
jgi:hypothetical protein